MTEFSWDFFPYDIFFVLFVLKISYNAYRWHKNKGGILLWD